MYRRLGDQTNQQSLPFLLKLSLARWAQLQIASNGQTFASPPSQARFFDDVTLGLKLHLADQSARAPSLSISFAASLPTTPQLGYTRTYDALGIIYVTKDLAWLHADLNLGLNLLALDTTPRPQPWIALALSVALPRGFGPMAELYYFSDVAPLAPADAGLLVALSWQPKHFLVLDAGADVGFIEKTRIASAFVGMTIIPIDLWDSGEERRAKLERQTRKER